MIVGDGSSLTLGVAGAEGYTLSVADPVATGTPSGAPHATTANADVSVNARGKTKRRTGRCYPRVRR